MVKFAYKSIENQQDQMPNWYRPNIDKKTLKELMQRRDLPAWINTICFWSSNRVVSLPGILGVHGGQFLPFLYTAIYIHS